MNTNLSNHADTVPKLSVENLAVRIGRGAEQISLVRNVSFQINKGERVGIIGESGSGKTLTAMSLLRLLSAPHVEFEGKALLDGEDLLTMSEAEIKNVRGRRIGMIFQEPLVALDPTFVVGEQIAETVRSHFRVSRKEAWARAVDALDAAGIPSPSNRAHSYPHELSGGMRQRVVIAIALACEPEVLIADEPTTALDVTIQAQILDLIVKLCEERNSALLLISHNIGVVAETCHRALTMYAGEVIEDASIADLLDRPTHPYTSSLLRCLPRSARPGQKLSSIPGRLPSPVEKLPGCRFAPRCNYCQEQCLQPQVLAPYESRRVRCNRAPQLNLLGAPE